VAIEGEVRGGISDEVYGGTFLLAQDSFDLLTINGRFTSLKNIILDGKGVATKSLVIDGTGLDSMDFFGQNITAKLATDTVVHIRNAPVVRIDGLYAYGTPGTNRALLISSSAHVWITKFDLEYADYSLVMTDTYQLWMSDGKAVLGDKYGISIEYLSRYIYLSNILVNEIGEHGIIIYAGITGPVFLSNVTVNRAGKSAVNTYDAIYCDKPEQVFADNMVIEDDLGNMRYGINDAGGGNWWDNVKVSGWQSAPIAGSPARVTGKQFSNRGIATILNGNSSVVVDHGLAVAPSVVKLTGTHSEVKDCWVTNVTSTQFTINAPAAVTADRDVYWQAEI